MILCAFCAYLSGYSSTKPKLESYYHEHEPIPYGFTNMDDSGATLTEDFRLLPRQSSDMFDKTELLIVCNERQKMISVYKIVCDMCLFAMMFNGECVVLKELDEKEKLCRMFLRNRK